MLTGGCTSLLPNFSSTCQPTLMTHLTQPHNRPHLGGVLHQTHSCPPDLSPALSSCPLPPPHTHTCLDTCTQYRCNR